jgi:hypothetical protein
MTTFGLFTPARAVPDLATSHLPGTTSYGRR